MSFRLPFGAKYVESCLRGARARLPLELPVRAHVQRVTQERMSENTYAEPRGAFLELTERLRAVASEYDPAETGGGNHARVVLRWYSTCMSALMSYSTGLIRRVDLGPEHYYAIVREYEGKCLEPFISSDISAERNYENYEFIGDNVWKTALVTHFWRRLGIHNESILTNLKHTHENTKALSDLARHLSLDRLVRHGGTKAPEALYEDVFEAVIGVLQDLQWELQRDLGRPEAMELAADNGFANRLVKMLFDCTDARYERRIAPKTFITSLQWTFCVGKDKLQSKQQVLPTGQPEIRFFAPSNVCALIAHTFGADPQKVGAALNTRYVAENPRANAKHFSALAHEDLVAKLAAQGISGDTFQAHRNRNLVPGDRQELLGKVAAAATQKGFWLSLNIPKTKGRDTRALELHASLYHDSHSFAVPKVIVPLPGPEERALYSAAVASALERLLAILAKIPEAKPYRPRASRGSTTLRFSSEAPTEGGPTPEGPECARSARRAPQWALAAARTNIGRGHVLQSAIAGQNLAHQNSEAGTLEYLVSRIYTRPPHAYIGTTLYTEIAETQDRQLAGGVAAAIRGAQGLVAVFLKNAATTPTTYTLIVFTPDPSAERYAEIFGATTQGVYTATAGIVGKDRIIYHATPLVAPHFLELLYDRAAHTGFTEFPNIPQARINKG